MSIHPSSFLLGLSLVQDYLYQQHKERIHQNMETRRGKKVWKCAKPHDGPADRRPFFVYDICNDNDPHPSITRRILPRLKKEMKKRYGWTMDVLTYLSLEALLTGRKLCYDVLESLPEIIGLQDVVQDSVWGDTYDLTQFNCDCVVCHSQMFFFSASCSYGELFSFIVPCRHIYLCTRCAEARRIERKRRRL